MHTQSFSTVKDIRMFDGCIIKTVPSKDIEDITQPYTETPTQTQDTKMH